MIPHEPIELIASAEKDLMEARALCTTSRIIDLLDLAFSKVYLAGDRMFPTKIDDMREKIKKDVMQ